MKKYKIAVLIGSLRKESFTLKIGKAMESVAPTSIVFDFIQIGDLPFYNDDLEPQPPKEWVAFRKEIQAVDGLLFLTPEYNRSVPAVLKNAIDVGSRPYGKNVFGAKPGAVVSVSPGNLGAFGANHHLRQSLVCLNIPTIAQPEAYIAGVADMFDDEGNLTNESTKKFLTSFMESFGKWVAIHAK